MRASAASSLASAGPQVFDACGDLAAATADIAAQFAETGAVHVTGTGIGAVNDLLPCLPQLGFGPDEQFSGGGRTAAEWQEKWVAPGLRRLDFYPPHLYLLPNGEIHYQRDFPARVLFFCAIPPERGGETFLHSADATAAAIAAQGAAGRGFLEKLRRHGQMIETGFLDRAHPRKKQNYHQSWQERFGTHDRDAALAEAKSRSREYDDCWWVEDDGHPVLMTRITLPGFFEDHMRFSRLAADGPSTQNGFRRFPFGDGAEFSEAEKRLLKQAYLATAQGRPWHQGDLILMDNIRYAHSRAPFTGPREVYLGMAGMKQINK